MASEKIIPAFVHLVVLVVRFFLEQTSHSFSGMCRHDITGCLLKEEVETSWDQRLRIEISKAWHSYSEMNFIKYRYADLRIWVCPYSSGVMPAIFLQNWSLQAISFECTLYLYFYIHSPFLPSYLDRYSCGFQIAQRHIKQNHFVAIVVLHPKKKAGH